MPQLTSIVLKDGLEADQTFTPRGIVGGVATLVKSNGVPVGDVKITASHTRTQTGREKIVLKLQIPVVQDVTVNGISKPTVVRSAFADITFTVDQTSNDVERDHLVGYTWNLIGNALTRSLVVDLEDIY
jgi:hypothetical protein